MNKRQRDDIKAILFKKDPRCTGCKYKAPVAHFLTLDHKKPIKDGGTNDIANLQLMCVSCNPSKGIRAMDAFREELEIIRKEYPGRVDAKELASSLWLRILKSDDGEHFVLTGGHGYFGNQAIPFDNHILIDGVSHWCEVRDFSTFNGLVLPYHVFNGVGGRDPGVKVEYSLVWRVDGEVHRFPPACYSFYWRRDSPMNCTAGTTTDLSYWHSEDPSKDIRVYPQNIKGD